MSTVVTMDVPNGTAEQYERLTAKVFPDGKAFSSSGAQRSKTTRSKAPSTAGRMYFVSSFSSAGLR